MAKRKTPNYRGVLARPINPWREDVLSALDERRVQLLLAHGINANAKDADARAARALLLRHGTGSNAKVPGYSAVRVFLALAAAHVPGFRLVVQRYDMQSIYAARYPKTRSSELLFADIAALVRAVNGRSQVNVRGRRSGIKRAINAVTETGQAFSHLRCHRGRLEWIYHRHRHRVPPIFPSLTWCARPDNQTCFGDEVFFDEAPALCQAKQECDFWKGWEVWASYFAAEYLLETRVLVTIEMYRRLTSRRRRAKA